MLVSILCFVSSVVRVVRFLVEIGDIRNKFLHMRILKREMFHKELCVQSLLEDIQYSEKGQSKRLPQGCNVSKRNTVARFRDTIIQFLMCMHRSLHIMPKLLYN